MSKAIYPQVFIAVGIAVVHLLIGLLTERTLLFSLLCLLEGWFAEAEWTSVHWHVGHCNWCSLAIHWAIQAKLVLLVVS